ncbi:hypothetical protein SDJN03_09026, partial [Cucurbita argyrosperma subsp. sororia]
MEPFNPFFAYPFNPKTGFPIFWRKALPPDWSHSPEPINLVLVHEQLLPELDFFQRILGLDKHEKDGR